MSVSAGELRVEVAHDLVGHAHVLAQERSSVASILPAFSAFMTGICRPSSKTSRASAERMRPPMSGAVRDRAREPDERPVGWKIGFATVMSGRWPVPSQMSLVIRMSPGVERLGRILLEKVRIVRGTVPMNDGMLSVACASEGPAHRSARTRSRSIRAPWSERRAHQRRGGLVDDRDQAAPWRLQSVDSVGA